MNDLPIRVDLGSIFRPAAPKFFLLLVSNCRDFLAVIVWPKTALVSATIPFSSGSVKTLSLEEAWLGGVGMSDSFSTLAFARRHESVTRSWGSRLFAAGMEPEAGGALTESVCESTGGSGLEQDVPISSSLSLGPCWYRGCGAGGFSTGTSARFGDSTSTFMSSGRIVGTPGACLSFIYCYYIELTDYHYFYY